MVDAVKRAIGNFAMLVAIMAPILGTSCGQSGKSKPYRETRVIMGTVVEITVLDLPEERARRAVGRALAEMERIDREMGWEERDGGVGRVNAGAAGGPVAVSRELVQVLEAAVEVASASGGAFDPTIGPLARAWSFDGGGVVPDDSLVEEARSRVGYRNLILDKENSTVGFMVDGMQLDLGGVAKGWAVDVAASVLVEAGARSAIVDAGGDLRLIGGKGEGVPWKIGVQDPRDPGALLLTLDLAGTAVATSGDYERFFERDGVRYHHVLDPATGRPAPGCRSVTVVAPTAQEADACATAAFVLGPERGLAFLRSRPGVRGLIVGADGALRWSRPATGGGSPP